MSHNSERNVFLFVPNLIGYGRIVLTLIAILIYDHFPLTSMFCYILSFVLDAIDGHAARYLQQCSRFGAVLDMVTDRFSTAALATILAVIYPKLMLLFIFLNILDFVSHWMRMYSCLLLGEESHKNQNPKHGYLLNLYYTNKIFMCILCLGNEFFYIYMFIKNYYPASQWINLLIFSLLIPTWGMKQVMNIIQLKASAVDIVDFESEKRTK